MKQEIVRVRCVRVPKFRRYLQFCQFTFREPVCGILKAVRKFRRRWVAGRQPSQDRGADAAVV